MEDDLLFFVEYYFPDYLTCDHAEYHRKDYEHFQDSIGTRVRSAKAEPRDHGKTSRALFKKAWIILTKKKKYILSIADSSGQAIMDNMNLIHELKNNPRILEDFGNVIPDHSDKDSQSDFITRDGIRVQAVGSGTKLRGRRHRASRPDIVFIDDLENDLNVQSETQRKFLWNWVHGTILPMLDKATGDLFIHGTILHYFSVLNRLINEKTRWRTGRHAACDPDFGNILWPSKFTESLLREEAEDLGPFQFQREYLNNPVSEEDVVFQKDWIKYYKQLPALDRFDDIVAAVDPVYKGKTRSDFYAMVIIGRIRESKFILHVYRARTTIQKAMRRTLELCKKYKVRICAVEDNTFQEMVKDELEKAAVHGAVDTYFEGMTSSTDKYARILRLQAPFNRGEYYLPEKAGWLTEYLGEYMYYPQANNDDQLDATEMADRMLKTGEMLAGHI